MIPARDRNGLLPPGIHDCTLAEIRHEFTWSARRLLIFSGLEAFIQDKLLPDFAGKNVYIDGSFVRSKPDPDDIDVVVDIYSPSNPNLTNIGLQLCSRRVALKAQYNVDMWPKHPHLPNDLVAFFQYVGDKAAAELQIDSKDAKGILRIQI